MEYFMHTFRILFFLAGLFVGVGLFATLSRLQQSRPKPAVILEFKEPARTLAQTPKGPQRATQIPSFTPPPILHKDPLYWNWKEINTENIYFPADFLWGVATSAHQTEGNCVNDWTEWEKHKKLTPTNTACNHWHMYKQDIQLIKKLGLNTYRLSVEWSKIEPKQGIYDSAALAHYDEVCKELVAHGIKPVITLHHYTNPTWFAQLGGFEKLENSKHFVNFCIKVFERLNPNVHLWLTFNSPTSYVARAYHANMAPPGQTDMQLMQEVLKNMLETHVQVYQTLKKLPGGATAQIGMCHNIYQVEAKNFWDKAGVSTAQALFGDNIYNFFKTGHFKVSVPFKAKVNHYNAAAPQSLDFVGLNYYSHGLMTNFNVDTHPGEITTQNKIYTIYPEGFYRALQELTTQLAKPLNIPIYVTENGIATKNEEHRELFFKQYLYALSYALNSGCPIKGYIVWSLMDNYDWGSYDINFGLYAVDFKTHQRSENVRPGARYFIDVVQKFKAAPAVNIIETPKKTTAKPVSAQASGKQNTTCKKTTREK
jgi:beta-glucosidase